MLQEGTDQLSNVFDRLGDMELILDMSRKRSLSSTFNRVGRVNAYLGVQKKKRETENAFRKFCIKEH